MEEGLASAILDGVKLDIGLAKLKIMGIRAYEEVLQNGDVENIGEVLEELEKEKQEAFPDVNEVLGTCVPSQTLPDELYEARFVLETWKCGLTESSSVPSEGNILFLCPVHFSEFNAKRRAHPETEIEGGVDPLWKPLENL